MTLPLALCFLGGLRLFLGLSLRLGLRTEPRFLGGLFRGGLLGGDAGGLFLGFAFRFGLSLQSGLLLRLSALLLGPALCLGLSFDTRFLGGLFRGGFLCGDAGGFLFGAALRLGCFLFGRFLRFPCGADGG